MRTSLTVMPRRGLLYGAKLGVFAAVSLAVALVTSFGTFFLGQALLGRTHATVSLSDPGVLRAVIITALFTEVCGLFAFGVGAIVRSTAAALTIAYGFLALLHELVRALPTPLYHALMAWVPGGQAIAELTATSEPLFISPKVVEKHVANIFDKLGLAPSDSDNRRVIAAIRYLES
jgi:ABC-2 type transport system permease protein